jgi:hypothetical protein
MSTYRAPLLEADGTLGDHFKVLTYQQFAKFAMWSLQLNRPVLDLMSGLMVESMRDPEDPNAVCIEGVLPHCGLYGCMLPDGSTHT